MAATIATNNSRVYISDIEYDKYAGRYLGKISLTPTSTAINNLLIEKSLAIPYFGEKKTHIWCTDDGH